MEIFLNLINYLANMKKLITLSFCLCIVSLSAQTATEDYYSGSKPKKLSKDRVSASISAGTGISFLNGKNTAFTTFIAPKIGYQLTNKFKLNIGLMHYSITGNTFMPLNQNESLLNNSNKTVTGNLIFAEGQYQLNKRTVLSGALMVDASNSNRQNNFKAVSMGLDYKVSKHSTIGFRATVSQGTSDYQYNPKSGKYDYNPYNQSFWGSLAPIAAEMGIGALNSAIK
jgi:hypothetical protein